MHIQIKIITMYNKKSYLYKTYTFPLQDSRVRTESPKQ